MEIFGVGPFEFLVILLIALIVLGPGDMVKAGRTLGRFMHKVVTSSEWRTVQKASRELRYLPNKLMREANLEDISKEMGDINKIGGQLSGEIKTIETDISAWTTPPESTPSILNVPQPTTGDTHSSEPPINPEKPG